MLGWLGAQAAAGDEAAEALGNGSGSAAADTGQTEGGREIDLQPYVNTSALTVDEGFSAERTYILLRTLGLRHITIVDRCAPLPRPLPHPPHGHA